MKIRDYVYTIVSHSLFLIYFIKHIKQTKNKKESEENTMENKNRKCKVCRTEYYYCPTCPSETRPKWMKSYCSDNCRDIGRAMIEFTSGRCSKEDTIKKLFATDLTHLSEFDEDAQELINDLMGKKSAEAKEEVVELVEKPTEAPEQEAKPANKYSKKNNKGKFTSDTKKETK